MFQFLDMKIGNNSYHSLGSNAFIDEKYLEHFLTAKPERKFYVLIHFLHFLFPVVILFT